MMIHDICLKGTVMFPTRCACCAGPANTAKDVYRSSELVDRRHAKRSYWRMPYCQACLAHEKEEEAVRSVGVGAGWKVFVVLTIIAAGAGAVMVDSVPRSMLSMNGKLGVVGACVALVLAVIAAMVAKGRQNRAAAADRARGLFSPTCPPREIPDGHTSTAFYISKLDDRDTHEFLFASKLFADAFVEVNRERITKVGTRG